MKHKKYKPDIAEWNMDALEELNKNILKAVNEAIGYALNDEQTRVYFPVEYSGDPKSEDEESDSDGIGGGNVEDPLTVYFCIAVCNNDNEVPTYEFNLRDVLSNSIEDCAKDGSYSFGLGRLSASLRTLADEIDAARKKSKK